MSKLRVAVLMGGHSTEREVSLRSGAKVAEALDPTKYDVLPLDLAALELPRQIWSSSPAPAPNPALHDPDQALAPATGKLAQLRHESAVDVAFLAVHGRGGEDGCLQGMLELIGLPYTGSGVLASALAMNKILTKKVLDHDHIRTPAYLHYRMDNGHPDRVAMGHEIAEQLGLPAVVKPASQGSTIGITVVEEEEALPKAIDHALHFDTEVLVEQFIVGTEVAVGVLGNQDLQVLPIVEVVPQGGFYDYQAKYTPGATEEIVPARIPGKLAQEAREFAQAAYRSLGCRGLSRLDMIATPDGMYVLEVNTIPGLTETSLLPCAARAAGIEFPQLIERLLDHALEGST